MLDASERLSRQELRDRAEARPGVGPERREQAAAEVATAVKDGAGVSVEVAVVDPETLERSVGKIKRIVDLR